LQRFSDSAEFINLAELKNHTTLGNAKNFNYNQIKYYLIESSLEDINQINYQPQISLELFNYALALIVFSLRYSSCLWYLNKLYALAFSFHIMLFGLLSIFSLATFEILYKFQVCFSHGINFKMSNQNFKHLVEHSRSLAFKSNSINIPKPTNESLLVKSVYSILKSSDDGSHYKEISFVLPFATRPLTLQLTFLLTIFLFFISTIPIYAYGVYQYELKFRRLREYFANYLHLCSGIAQPKESIYSKTEYKQQQQQQQSKQNRNPYLSMNSLRNETATSQIQCNNEASNYQDKNTNTLGIINDNEASISLLANKFINNIGDAKSILASSNLPPPPPPPPHQPPPPFSQSSSKLFNMLLNTSQSKQQRRMSGSVASSSSISSYESFLMAPGFKTPRSSSSSIYRQYKMHFLALIILVLICFNSSIMVYDYICLYQLTSDTIPFWTCILYIAFILWYIMLWLVLTFNTKWNVEFSFIFKLNYWNLANKLISLGATNGPSEQQQPKEFEVTEIGLLKHQSLSCNNFENKKLKRANSISNEEPYSKNCLETLINESNYSILNGANNYQNLAKALPNSNTEITNLNEECEISAYAKNKMKRISSADKLLSAESRESAKASILLRNDSKINMSASMNENVNSGGNLYKLEPSKSDSYNMALIATKSSNASSSMSNLLSNLKEIQTSSTNFLATDTNQPIDSKKHKLNSVDDFILYENFNTSNNYALNTSTFNSFLFSNYLKTSKLKYKLKFKLNCFYFH
jgi:hypothetical protein